ncbi:glycerol-3-phosphate acyltransferase [Thermoflexus sp.]|uniref:glycerol-3-phosphate acyltransferase n=1 Tax=Thermoflexus sp. TaxID=1969742 RepID=UPI002601362A|nr:glycerol-3-phosphate acyltransferase [Thermoflexus sp.]MDW8180844.1 glycerol-3-phosphate acyltransferase [Anaerolineae bacterium]MCS6964760.1 glycerol-3-phosphate acyltransferase [Thermoflexus sp.]MCS7351388.1 glycerol-3-phosphate acyltransferase [Thermoflexus sp.]MCX7689310.1 glycerol-3-phosphate acyltransferase [Thermoflexus sp.]MDW8186001.1 glycerol-3-phosphate acyltransferase [Anaerolineae bacterium]
MGLWLALAAYLAGSILPAEIFVRWKTGRSPHEFEDNPGGGGAWRLAGPVAGMITILFDLGKGAVPTWIALRAGLSLSELIAVAVAPVIGHCWPFYKVIRLDRGGRGLGPATGALFALAFREVVPAYVLGALAAYRFRWLPSVGIVAFPLSLIFMLWWKVPPERLAAAFAVMLVVLIRNVGLLWTVVQTRGKRLPH